MGKTRNDKEVVIQLLDLIPPWKKTVVQADYEEDDYKRTE